MIPQTANAIRSRLLHIMRSKHDFPSKSQIVFTIIAVGLLILGVLYLSFRFFGASVI